MIFLLPDWLWAPSLSLDEDASSQHDANMQSSHEMLEQDNKTV